MSYTVSLLVNGSVEAVLSKYSSLLGSTNPKEGQQPVKYTSAGNRKRGISDDEDEAGTDSAKPLYSEMQTEIYVPLPIENGIVPKNNYGNIDVYTPSMVPAGGAHIVRPSISLAAQFAGIDYADAVTGFDFVKNKASARLNGIVVATEKVEGLLVVWEGMMERVQGEEERIRVRGVLERWRRFFVRLGIRRRLDETHGKIEGSDQIMADEEHEEEEGEGDMSGGFLLGAVQDGRDFAREPEGQAMRSPDFGSAYDGGGGFFAAESTSFIQSEQQSGFEEEPRVEDTAPPNLSIDIEQTQTLSVKDNSSKDENDAERAADPTNGGGFIQDESEGGGFLPDAYEDSDGSDFMYEDEDGIL
jgi:xeroderma pigmentosum group C-complementing protein